MTNYNEPAIKKWLRENIESEMQRAQILNLIEGAAEVAYQRGLAHGQGKRYVGRPAKEPQMQIHPGGLATVCITGKMYEDIPF